MIKADHVHELSCWYLFHLRIVRAIEPAHRVPLSTVEVLALIELEALGDADAAQYLDSEL